MEASGLQHGAQIRNSWLWCQGKVYSPFLLGTLTFSEKSPFSRMILEPVGHFLVLTTFQIFLCCKHVFILIEKPISVGWGSKQTQFHGSEGKAAALKTPQIENPCILTWDDEKVRISWRGDGQLLVISSVHPSLCESNTQTFVIAVGFSYSRACSMSHHRCETASGF